MNSWWRPKSWFWENAVKSLFAGKGVVKFKIPFEAYWVMLLITKSFGLVMYAVIPSPRSPIVGAMKREPI